MVNSKNIVICRTNHEWRVKYPYYWSEEVIEIAKSKGFDITDLKNEDFISEKLNKLMNEKDPFFYIGSGHGKNWVLKGYKDEPVVEACKNDILFRNKIVYLLSCSTAEILGESAIGKGCPCFIGYYKKYNFVAQDPNPENILDDIFAQAFMEISNQIPLTIINGGTPTEAWKNSQKKCEEWIGWWGKSKLAIAPQIIGALLLNKKRQHIKTIK